MAIETLPNIRRQPDYGLTSSGEFTRDITAFGDGYELRRPSGLQPFRRSWSVNWTGLNPTDMETLRTFLNSKLGVTAFNCTIPFEGTLKVICPEPVSVTHASYRLFSLSATFQEDLNP